MYGPFDPKEKPIVGGKSGHEPHNRPVQATTIIGPIDLELSLDLEARMATQLEAPNPLLPYLIPRHGYLHPQS